MRNFESEQAQLCSSCLVVSQIDRDFIGIPSVNVLPIGVSKCSERSRNRAPSGNQKDIVICFFGNMNYSPNVEAVKWFAGECLPKILDVHPNVEVNVAGRDPQKGLLKLANTVPRLKISGPFDDLAEILGPADIVVAPMLSGSGMQNKILEAMAYGLPVVTTTTGMAI